MRPGKMFKRLGPATANRSGEATQKSIERTKGPLLISSKRISPFDANAIRERNNVAQEHMPERQIEVPKLYSANVKGPALALRQRALFEGVNREKITSAFTVNDLFSISGAYNRLGAIKRIGVKMDEPINRLSKQKREELFQAFGPEMEKGNPLQKQVKKTAWAIALNLIPKRK